MDWLSITIFITIVGGIGLYILWFIAKQEKKSGVKRYWKYEDREDKD